ncbi:MAG: hypothetical protein ACRC5S_10590 [Cetobacterium sp.]
MKLNYKETTKNEFIEVLFSSGKLANLDEVKTEIKKFNPSAEKVLIKKEILLSGVEFQKFNKDYFESYNFLNACCGIDTETGINIGIRVTNGRKSVIVLTGGYDYARYIGIEL